MPKRTRVIGLLRTLVALLLMDPLAVEANFFSRLVQFGTEREDDKKPAPSGATKARGSEAQVGSIITFENGVPLVHLANNNKIPLIGFGVGNLQHKFVPGMISEGLQADKKLYLIDTAHASNNEALVSAGVHKGVERLLLPEGEQLTVHIVTKVWYTHLGAERTKLSVEESLQAFQPLFDNSKLDVKVHMLLHWPRCFDNIPWMNCAKDEEDLPQYVKNAGPDPNQSPGTAWKESWKMLEDMYLSDDYPIASIGVSNFHLHDLEMMEGFSRIHPHILQVNMWSLLYDPHLVEYCHKHRIHVQVYNALQSTVLAPENAPRAFSHIQKVAVELANQTGTEVTPAQVILAWLIQHGITVIPRTSKMQRLAENSAVAIAKIPALNDHQVEAVAHSVEAYLSGDDLEKDIHVSVTFHAVNKDLMIYWLSAEDEVRLDMIRAGESFNETTYPKHRFRVYDATNKDVWVDHQIDADFGEHVDIHVEL